MGAEQIHWSRTLLDWASASARRAPPQWHWQTTKQPAAALVLLLVDCSASMVQSGALALAKAMSLALMERAYRARNQVALIEFAGAQAHLRVKPQRASWHNNAWVDPMRGGGGTPLDAAVAMAKEVLREPGVADKQVWLFTDGRVRHWPLAPAPASAIYVVDLEAGGPHQRLHRAQALAEFWRAQSVQR